VLRQWNAEILLLDRFLAVHRFGRGDLARVLAQPAF
jgi:hypothetical protein